MAEASVSKHEASEVTRLVTKRRCPFGESPQHNQVPAQARRREWAVDVKQDSAFEVLMNSYKQNTEAAEQPPGTGEATSKTCWVCQKPDETLPCTFCEHGACEMCVRQCDHCSGVFCSFCSTVNYDSREDRALCLTCQAEEVKQQKKQMLQARQPAMWSLGSTFQGCLPQATA